MMSLSKSTEYTIRALACLEGMGGSPCQISEIADQTGVPKAYLAKLMQKLVDNGIVDSKRGHKGGVTLKIAPAKVSLLRISEAIDGADWTEGCLLGSERCSDRRACPMHEFWKESRKRIQNSLSGTSLLDYITFEKRIHGGLTRCGDCNDTPAKPKTKAAAKTTKKPAAKKTTKKK